MAKASRPSTTPAPSGPAPGGGSKRLAAVGGAILAVALVVAATLLGRTPPPAVVEPGPVVRGPMSEEERMQYVKAFVRVEGLTVGPDMKPDGDAAVPGLLRVTGEVLNEGEREVDKVILVVLPKDASGEVVSAYVQDVAKKGGALGPGQRRAFAFTLPDDKAYDGAFDHELR